MRADRVATKFTDVAAATDNGESDDGECTLMYVCGEGESNLGHRFCRLLLFLLLRRAPRALEGGPSELQHLPGVDRDDSEWVGGRTTEGTLSEDMEVRASLQPVFHCLRLLLAQWVRRDGYRI